MDTLAVKYLNQPGPPGINFTSLPTHWGGHLDTLIQNPWAAGISLLATITLYAVFIRKDVYDGIPAIGNTGWISSYMDALAFSERGKAAIVEGYKKHKPGIFRIRTTTGWRVIVTSIKHAEEIRLAPDNVLSNNAALREEIASDYTLYPYDPFKSGGEEIIKNNLTRNIGRVFSEIRDELEVAIEKNLPATDDWSPVKILFTMMKVVSQSANRIFVGLPLCRDPDFIQLNINFTIDMMRSADKIKELPVFLKPFAALWYRRSIAQHHKTAFKLVTPLVEERKQKMAELGNDYPDKPNDLLTWMLDKATGDNTKTRMVVLNMLMFNVAAIHTTSMTFTNVLLDLVARPEYIEPLRKEAETIIAEEGWSKKSVSRMRKLDSFVKESQRLHGMGASTLLRRTLTDFTFSDGTRIPKGTFVSAATEGIHQDEEYYENSTTFDGFRFCKGKEGMMNQLAVTTSATSLTFGHGAHACPGRFFALYEIKSMLAHTLLTYDVKAADGATGRPPNLWIGFNSVPDPESIIMFKRRS